MAATFKNRRVTLECGDAMRLLEKLPSDRFGAVITDPVFSSVGSASQASGKKWYSGKQSAPDYVGETRDARSWVRWMASALSECHRVAKPHATLLAFSDWRMLPSLSDAVQMGGWIWRGVPTWNKGRGTRPCKGGFRSQNEYIVWATKGSMRVDAEEYIDGCIEAHRRAEEKTWHQHSKPDALLDELVRVAAKGEIILDPFMGGGSTGTAALRRGCRFHGIELSRECFALTAQRFREAA